MLEVPKMQTNKLSNNKWINRHIVSSYKKTQQFRNAKGATNPSLFFSPVLWSLLEHQGFLGHFLHWQEEKKKKRTIPEESSKIIKENWTKTCNEERTASQEESFYYEKQRHVLLYWILTFLDTLKPLEKQTLLLKLSCCQVQNNMTLELPEKLLRELRDQVFPLTFLLCSASLGSIVTTGLVQVFIIWMMYVLQTVWLHDMWYLEKSIHLIFKKQDIFCCYKILSTTVWLYQFK